METTMGVNLDASDLREALWDFMQKWEANHQWVFTDLTDALTKHTEALNANTAAMAGKVQPEPYTGDLQGQIADLQQRTRSLEAKIAAAPITLPQGTLDHVLGKINEQSRGIQGARDAISALGKMVDKHSEELSNQKNTNIQLFTITDTHTDRLDDYEKRIETLEQGQGANDPTAGPDPSLIA
jgi:chromosome segregation ATPase